MRRIDSWLVPVKDCQDRRTRHEMFTHRTHEAAATITLRKWEYYPIAVQTRSWKRPDDACDVSCPLSQSLLKHANQEVNI